MKKLLFFILIACSSTALFAQTIVSTVPANKNVLVEDFTGTYCVYCPNAHKAADKIMASHPGRAWGINIHQGGFAGNDPDFRTPWGDPLAAPHNLTGWPSGMVNRRANANSNYSQWASQANAILAQASPVNVAAQGTIDYTTRMLSLYVEVYYTGNAVNPTNKLSVALLQSNIMAFQAGSYFYIDMVEGDLYRHNHMLRDLLTGLWGVDVTPTTTGSFWSETFEYEIPLDFRDVEVVLEDLEILVFIAENERTVLTVTQADITYVNLPELGARIERLNDIPVYDCSANVRVAATIQNAGATPITSLELTYTIAGGASNTFVWNNRSIATMTKDTIQLPVFQVQTNQDQEIKIEIVKINNVPISAVSGSKTIRKDVPQGDVAMIFVLATDQHASQSTFKIFNPDGTILLQGGPWSNLQYYGVTVRRFDFIPVMEGCHKVEVYDSSGDGISPHYGAGYIEIFNNAGERIYYNNGQFGAKATAMVTVNATATMNKIVSSTGINGTIEPLGTKFYVEGTSAEYTFKPNNGYIVRELFIDEVSIPDMEGATSYTFPSVDKDYTIRVTFRVKPIGIEDVNGVAISIAPNPVNYKLYVTGMYDKLEIISITGQTLSTIYNEPAVDVSHLAKGIYFVKIHANGQIGTFKVINQ